MRRILLLSALLWPASAAAQDTASKPNTLTPKEIADGWLLLFDGESTFGWSGESIKAEDGKLVIKGDGMKKALCRHLGQFGDFEAKFEHSQPANSRYTANLFFQTFPLALAFSTKSDDNTWRKEWFKSRVAAGALTWETRQGATFYLRNVKVKPLNLTPIFNGKDLTGWKEFPGKKSKFTVTPQGEINVKDGPGDLQTEAKYDDFILQLDCISNGKHLNSGVFFRCRPNEYQNGYEAQIRNQFTAEPTQDYVIEDYDPVTHKLLGKKKEKFAAVDYGTGAIYRRVPARKEVAKDGEWFTYTILAHKNHFMTWVNGIQVVDWTDNRPPSDNARNGYRQEAGHISLQGHDPTTDLSFRNFRIGVLK